MDLELDLGHETQKSEGGDQDVLGSGLSDPLQSADLGSSGPPSKDGGDILSGDDEYANKGIALVTKDSYELALSVPLPLPGVSVNVSAKVTTKGKDKLSNETLTNKAKKVEKSTTSFDAEIKAGVSFNVAFFTVGLRAVGTLSAEVEGTDSLATALSKAVSEFTRWRLSDEVASISDKIAKVDPIVTKRRGNIVKSFDDIDKMIGGNSIDVDEVVTETTTEKPWWNPTRTALENIRKESESLADDLKDVCGISKADEAKQAANYFIDVGLVTSGVKQLGEIVEKGASADEVKLAAMQIRTDTLARVADAQNKARSSIKALDFKVPTPGVKVSGTIGAEVFVGFAGGAASAEVSVGAGMKFDTSKTKTEKDDEGNDKEVFDKTWDKVVTLNGQVEAGGFKGEVGLVFSWSGGEKSIEGDLDLKTPKLPLGIQKGDLKDTLQLVRHAMADAGKESKATVEGAKKNQQEGTLKKVFSTIKSKYEALEPAIDALTYGYDKGKRIAEGDMGKTSIVAGGSLSIEAGKASGTAYLGLGSALSLDMEVGGVGVKAEKVSSERLTLPWSG